MTGRKRYHPFLFSRLHSILLGDTKPLFDHPSEVWILGDTHRRRTEVAKWWRTPVFLNLPSSQRGGIETHGGSPYGVVPRTWQDETPNEAPLPQRGTATLKTRRNTRASPSLHSLFVSWIRASNGSLPATSASTSRRSPDGRGTREKAIKRDRTDLITETTGAPLLWSGHFSVSWLSWF